MEDYTGTLFNLTTATSHFPYARLTEKNTSTRNKQFVRCDECVPVHGKYFQGVVYMLRAKIPYIL